MAALGHAVLKVGWYASPVEMLIYTRKLRVLADFRLA